MTTGTDLGSNEGAHRRLHVSDRVRGALVVAAGAGMMVGLAVAALSMLTSPDSWVMKAANQAMLDQQAVATSYLISSNGE